jgi:hypothetical protein
VWLEDADAESGKLTDGKLRAWRSADVARDWVASALLPVLQRPPPHDAATALQLTLAACDGCVCRSSSTSAPRPLPL